MRAYDIITKKRDGGTLTREEILFVIGEFTAGRMPDYQMAAFLMAVFIRKLDGRERADLTLGMLNSGSKMDFSHIPGYKIDKHSTGGVGDGVSLSLAPLVAEAGALIPMMSGRGLGHTGGTLDKLEAIPGYKVELTVAEIEHALRTAGLVIMGQTPDIAPADKLMYALRDVTATVDSIDLISGSIMSKKLAEGMDGLILDVKTGKGAFMQTYDDAVGLAKSMIEIGVNLGKDMRALVTDMNQPLGRAVGNNLEMVQAVEILQGKGPKDITEVVLQHGTRMLLMAKLAPDAASARKKLANILASGAGVARFAKMAECQGGDPSYLEHPEKFPRAPHTVEVKAPQGGYITDIDALTVGKCAQALGAGRVTKDSVLDLSVGYLLEKKVGDKVSAGEVTALACVNDRDKFAKTVLPEFIGAYSFGDSAPQLPPLVYSEVTSDRVTRLDVPRP